MPDTIPPTDWEPTLDSAEIQIQVKAVDELKNAPALLGKLVFTFTGTVNADPITTDMQGELAYVLSRFTDDDGMLNMEEVAVSVTEYRRGDYADLKFTVQGHPTGITHRVEHDDVEAIAACQQTHYDFTVNKYDDAEDATHAIFTADGRVYPFNEAENKNGTTVVYRNGKRVVSVQRQHHRTPPREANALLSLGQNLPDCGETDAELPPA